MKNLPYKRNPDKIDFLCILKDHGGTCSTKHVFLKRFADEIGEQDVRLMMCIFMMNADNTPKISPVLKKYNLPEMPEAHNYLRIKGEIVDCTRRNSKASDFVKDMKLEIEISPAQITDCKVQFQKDYIKDYLSNHPQIPYSNDEFWDIREDCIAALQS